jgi:hypothetical protein
MKKQLVIKTWYPTQPNGYVYQPDLPHNFCHWIDLDIGYAEENARASFSIGVCSFTWLAHQYSNEGPRWGRHLLVVGQYNYEEIKRVIEERVQSCSRETWEESLKILCRDFAWEFEDYKP